MTVAPNIFEDISSIAFFNLNNCIDSFFQNDTKNPLQIGDLITDMIVELDHLNWHTNNVLSEAKDIAQYFYSK